MKWDERKAAQAQRRARERGETALLGEGCPTGKRLFKSRSMAKKALKRTMAQRQTEGADKIERAIYECRMCKGWHLTSQEQRSSLKRAA